MNRDPVAAQYEVYPYPARDPADEARRLIEGSPSHPVEIDHFVFAGRRDWHAPFRALVAGGGTGDGLVMLAQKLADIGCPADITYLDASRAARRIVEERVAARGLGGIRFVTADLLEAPQHGTFDYIDCCGVLHHLADPDAGFAALAAALAPGGGIGLMVYAPLGRAGVYPLQAAFAALMPGAAPPDRLRAARAVVAALPEHHLFNRNPLLGDHRDSDAGFYDLLLHGRDRAYSVGELDMALTRAGLARAGFVEGGRYDPLRYLPAAAGLTDRVDALCETDRAALAERLAGTMKTHVLYAVRADETEDRRAGPRRAAAVPHLRRVAARALAGAVQAGRRTPFVSEGVRHDLVLPREAAPLIAAVGGGRSLGAIAAGAGLDWMRFSAVWSAVDRELTAFNLLAYSEGGRP